MMVRPDHRVEHRLLSHFLGIPKSHWIITNNGIRNKEIVQPKGKKAVINYLSLNFQGCMNYFVLLNTKKASWMNVCN